MYLLPYVLHASYLMSHSRNRHTIFAQWKRWIVFFYCFSKLPMTTINMFYRWFFIQDFCFIGMLRICSFLILLFNVLIIDATNKSITHHEGLVHQQPNSKSDLWSLININYSTQFYWFRLRLNNYYSRTIWRWGKCCAKNTNTKRWIFRQYDLRSENRLSSSYSNFVCCTKTSSCTNGSKKKQSMSTWSSNCFFWST